MVTSSVSTDFYEKTKVTDRKTTKTKVTMQWVGIPRELKSLKSLHKENVHVAVGVSTDFLTKN